MENDYCSGYEGVSESSTIVGRHSKYFKGSSNGVRNKTISPPTNDSAGASGFDSFYPAVNRPSRSNRGSSNGSMSVGGAGKVSYGGGSMNGGGIRGGGAAVMPATLEKENSGMTFRDTEHEMEDQERQMLLSLLSGAYEQVLIWGFT